MKKIIAALLATFVGLPLLFAMLFADGAPVWKYIWNRIVDMFVNPFYPTSILLWCIVGSIFIGLFKIALVNEYAKSQGKKYSMW